jgi:hypothetical protein
MKTIGIIIIGFIAIAIIVFLVVVEILELLFGAVFILLAIVATIWIYNRIKNKLNKD